MKDIDQKIVALLYALFGSFLAFLVFTFALGGWRFVFTGKSMTILRGPVGLFISIALGAVLGWLSYRHRHYESGALGTLAQDTAGGVLLGKRIVVIISCVVALYYIWQLAKSAL
jgi:hypothetical protein